MANVAAAAKKTLGQMGKMAIGGKVKTWQTWRGGEGRLGGNTRFPRGFPWGHP
jgi:hypothetical protein